MVSVIVLAADGCPEVADSARQGVGEVMEDILFPCSQAGVWSPKLLCLATASAARRRRLVRIGRTHLDIKAAAHSSIRG